MNVWTSFGLAKTLSKSIYLSIQGDTGITISNKTRKQQFMLI